MVGDIQDVKRELKLLIASDQFTAVLSKVDAEKGVSVATPGPTQVFDAEKANIEGLGFPVAEVVGHQTTYDLTSQQLKSAIHQVEVRWTHNGDDELVITKQLENLVRATRDLLWPPNGPIGLPMLASWPVEIVSEQYSALFPTGSGNAFIKGSATLLRVGTETL